MVTVKLLSAISYDGVRKKMGDEITMTQERFKEMQNNFEKQGLNINTYLEIVSVKKEIAPAVKIQPKQKRTRTKK